MQPIYCDNKDHKDNPLNLVCLEQRCPRKGLICSFCLLSEHQDHVKNVFPLKTIILSLNKANNPKNQEELRNKGNEIFEKHHKIKQVFRQSLLEIKEILTKLEKDVERQIKTLDIEADLFVGDAFEKSIAYLNQQDLTKQQIENSIFSIEPLLKISDGHIFILREAEINLQAQKLIKCAEILERESKYWLDRCITDLQKLSEICTTPSSNKQYKIKASQNRFQLTYEQWNLKEYDAISFQSKIKNDIWLSGVGVYQVTNWPQAPLYFHVSIFEGQVLQKYLLSQKRNKLLYQDKFLVSEHDDYPNHIGRIFLNKAIKLQPDQFYTLAIQPSQSCLSYYGANGKFETDDFRFEEPVFTKDYSNNSTTINQGVIPFFFYEE